MLKEKTTDVKDQTVLFATGLMDSLELLMLIEYVEKEFGIKLSDADLVPANFHTPDLVANLVIRLKGES